MEDGIGAVGSEPTVKTGETIRGKRVYNDRCAGNDKSMGLCSN